MIAYDCIFLHISAYSSMTQSSEPCSWPFKFWFQSSKPTYSKLYLFYITKKAASGGLGQRAGRAASTSGLTGQAARRLLDWKYST